jgi:large subunit ribosomal protein L13
MEEKFTMNNITYSAKSSDIQRKWYIIDASGKPLGRVAAEVAKLLRGKHKPTFTPNVDTGDHVIVLNCKDVILTGKKLDQKIYRHHTGYIGNMKEISAKDMLQNNPEKAMMLAIKGMLPKNRLGRQMLGKLRVYAGNEHENQAQKPEVWEVK